MTQGIRRDSLVVHLDFDLVDMEGHELGDDTCIHGGLHQDRIPRVEDGSESFEQEVLTSSSDGHSPGDFLHPLSVVVPPKGVDFLPSDFACGLVVQFSLQLSGLARGRVVRRSRSGRIRSGVDRVDGFGAGRRGGRLGDGSVVHLGGEFGQEGVQSGKTSGGGAVSVTTKIVLSSIISVIFASRRL